jgi:hypothetical protein
MNQERSIQGEPLRSGAPSSADLVAIATQIRIAAEQRRGNGLALLALLRLLEALHKEIQEGAFQDCLPDNRQGLYALLRDMEAEGGWPYIPRIKLQAVMQRMASEIVENGDSSGPENSFSNR